MKVYQVIADYGQYEDAYKITIGIWTDKDIAEYEKELYINNAKLVNEKLKPIIDQYYDDCDTLNKDEFDKKYDNNFWKKASLFRDCEDFNSCSIEEIELDKRLVDIMEDI